jgi:hypothetical protein
VSDHHGGSGTAVALQGLPQLANNRALIGGAAHDLEQRGGAAVDQPADLRVGVQHRTRGGRLPHGLEPRPPGHWHWFVAAGQGLVQGLAQQRQLGAECRERADACALPGSDEDGDVRPP